MTSKLSTIGSRVSESNVAQTQWVAKQKVRPKRNK